MVLADGEMRFLQAFQACHATIHSTSSAPSAMTNNDRGHCAAQLGVYSVCMILTYVAKLASVALLTVRSPGGAPQSFIQSVALLNVGSATDCTKPLNF
jgi:hypothetical protein